MRVGDSSVAEQLIAIQADSLKTQQQLGVAILSKQQEVEKNTSSALLDLLKSAVVDTGARSSLDIKA